MAGRMICWCWGADWQLERHPTTAPVSPRGMGLKVSFSVKEGHCCAIISNICGFHETNKICQLMVVAGASILGPSHHHSSKQESHLIILSGQKCCFNIKSSSLLARIGNPTDGLLLSAKSYGIKFRSQIGGLTWWVDARKTYLHC